MGIASFTRLVLLLLGVGFLVLLLLEAEDWLAYVTSLPVYFHVLLLCDLGLWCWATNLHLLNWLGIDTFALLEGPPRTFATPSPSVESLAISTLAAQTLPPASASGQGSKSAPLDRDVRDVLFDASLTIDGQGVAMSPAARSATVSATVPPLALHAIDGKDSIVDGFEHGGTYHDHGHAHAGAGADADNKDSDLDDDLGLADMADPSINSSDSYPASMNALPNRHKATIAAVYTMAIGFTTITLLSLWLFAVFANLWGEEDAEIIPLLTYLVVLFLVVNPWKFAFRKERSKFLRCLGRSAFGGLASAVPFSDVILSDILTSFSRVVGDLQLVFCDLVLAPDSAAHPAVALNTAASNLGSSAMHRFRGSANAEPSLSPSSFSDGSNLLAGSVDAILEATSASPSVGHMHASWTDSLASMLIALPFIFRLRQCIAEYNLSKDSKAKRRHLANALKYMSSLPVIGSAFWVNRLRTHLHSADAQNESAEHLVVKLNFAIGVWIALSTINSLYSLYWDVFVDWHLGYIPKLSKGAQATHAASSSMILPLTASKPKSASRHGGDLGAHASSGQGAGADILMAQSAPLVTASPLTVGTSVHTHAMPELNPSAASPTRSIGQASHTSSAMALCASPRSLVQRRNKQSGSDFPSDVVPPTPILLRPTLHFRYQAPYYAAIAIDTILRLSWIARVTVLYKLVGLRTFHSGTGSSGNDISDAQLLGTLVVMDLVLKTLEVLRRWMWVFFRIEREWVVVGGRPQRASQPFATLLSWVWTPAESWFARSSSTYHPLDRKMGSVV
ncbi:EXS family-domain-containing protein [Entophlyctis helioformis]|nr:EXS family-domain-containing protein [Entophlyctis helioformis]